MAGCRGKHAELISGEPEAPVLFIGWFGLTRNLFDLFDLKIGINGFNPIVARTDCHSHHVTMSIFRLLQVGLPVSGMVGTSVANTGGPANDE